jgi:hypothetical protein
MVFCRFYLMRPTVFPSYWNIGMSVAFDMSIADIPRYYGKSVPVESLSTDDLRFLNNAEAMEDSAYVRSSHACLAGADADMQFIENFKPPKTLLPLVEDDTLHPSNSPWFYYGGSYAGARAAHMRSQYPHLVWGAIASSGTSLPSIRPESRLTASCNPRSSQLSSVPRSNH